MLRQWAASKPSLARSAAIISALALAAAVGQAAGLGEPGLLMTTLLAVAPAVAAVERFLPRAEPKPPVAAKGNAAGR